MAIDVLSSLATASKEKDLSIAAYDWAQLILFTNYREDQFPPQIDKWIERARTDVAKYSNGEKVLVDSLVTFLKKERTSLKDGVIFVRDSWDSIRPRGFQGGEVRLTQEINKRSLWWNDHVVKLLKSGLNEVVNNGATSIVLKLGSGAWLDCGNFMLEPRVVGDSLNYPRIQTNLYECFGLKDSDFVYFPHVKHKPGFYEEPYQRFLFGDYVTPEVFVKSHKMMLDVLELNPVDPSQVWRKNVLLVPGTWFLDPDLGRTDSRLSWLSEITSKYGKRTVLGPCDELAPNQTAFSISQSGVRRKAYMQGKYIPQLTAWCIDQWELQRMISDVRPAEK